MKIELLAFDSMGVRSMSTFVETGDVKILIDPGLALGELRYGLKPHKIEEERHRQLAQKIVEKGKEADIIIISHFHYDHHDLGDNISLEIYNGKTVFIKDPKNNINRTQMDFRAPLFLGILKERAEKVEVADSKNFIFGETAIGFSKPLFHGANDRTGYVIETLIASDEKRIIHSSDVQGPISAEQTEFIIKTKPDLAIIDGPATYMLGNGFTQESLDQARVNLGVIMKNGLQELVLDHHLIRDINFENFLSQLKAEHITKKILTAAEYMGETNNPLEARRKELYKN